MSQSGATDVVDISGNGKGVSLDTDGDDLPARIVDNVAYINRQTSISNSSNLTRYEMNSGGLAAFGANILQITAIDPGNGVGVLETFHFENSSKPSVLQFGRNRGDGDVNSATFSRKTLAGDKLFQIGFYGGKDATSQQTAFAHAGYLTVTAEADNNGGNEQDSFISLIPGFTSGALGAGIQMNSKSQVLVPGPNRAAGIRQEDWGAVLAIGAGNATMPPIMVGVGPLTTVPVPGAIEFSSANNRYYASIGAVGSVSREQILTTKEFVWNGTVPNGGGSYTGTVRQGPDWIELTVVVGGADITSFNASLTYAALPVAPAVVGSYYCVDSTQPALSMQYKASTTKFNAYTTLGTNPLKAGQTYVFTLLVRQVS